MLSEEMIHDLIEGLQLIFEKNITQIILYGSVARQEESAESDIDIAVVSNMDQWGDVLPFYKNIRDEGIILWEK